MYIYVYIASEHLLLVIKCTTVKCNLVITILYENKRTNLEKNNQRQED